MSYTQGPLSPSVAINDSSSGTIAWVNPDNVKISDNTYAVANSSPNVTCYSQILKVSGFGFSIPTGAVINGITANIEHKNGATAPYDSSVYDNVVRLIKADGSLGTTNKSSAYTWSDTDFSASYGGVSDLWGDTWTPEAINNSNFGLALKVYMSKASGDPYPIADVDFISITVTYSNPAPTAPTGLTRANFDATEAANFTWTFNDAYVGDTQSAYQLLIYDASDNSLDYDSGKVSSAVSSKTLTAATLANNKQYQWKVRVYDSLDQVSPYSDLATFYTSAKPVCVITVPENDADTVASSSLTAEWTYSDTEAEAQSAYQAVLYSDADVILEDSTKLSGANLSYTYSYSLVDGEDYYEKITLWDAKGVASATVTRTFTVTYPSPPTPTVAYATDNTRGSMTLTITNPAPGEGEPSFLRNDIYRKKSTESVYIRIATGILEDATFVDYTPASGITYNYYVRSVGSTLAYTDSTVGSQSITLAKPQLALIPGTASDYQVLNYNTSRSQKTQYERTLMSFAGRAEPVAEFGEHYTSIRSLSILFFALADVQTFIDLLDEKSIILYRDELGHKDFVTVDNYGVVDNLPDYYTVTVDLYKVSYSEVT